LVVGLTLACSEQPAPDILLLTLDTTRFDALGAFAGGAARSPRLDALAAESLRFDQAVTTAPYTGPSHASMLTGLLPPEHGLRDFLGHALSPEALTLAELLARRGYVTGAFVSAYVLDPRFGLDQGFEVYSSPGLREGARYSERRAAETVNAALSWLGERATSRPFFAWVHLYDPHAPYAPPQSHRTALPSDATRIERQRALYRDEVGYMDLMIGHLLDGLDDLGRLEELVVVTVADHGEVIGEYGRPPGTHSPILYDLTLRVPLLVRAPGRVSPGVESRQVSVVDIFSTILELASAPVPEGIAGRSLLAIEGPRAAYSETLYEYFPKLAKPGQELVSVRLEGWKLIEGPDRSELYDLRRDPRELRDVSSDHPDKLSELHEALAAVRVRWSGGAISHPIDLDPDERDDHVERLRSLGYVE
jgi:choline-sulfatase